MEIKTDVTFFIGKEIQQVCFGLYEVQLHFNKEAIRIQIGSGLKYYERNGNTQNWHHTEGRNFFSINGLLEVPIKEALVDKDDNLKLYFENKEQLEVAANKDGNESYIVFRNNDFQVIY